jgi:tRNA/tmRNA/rRNA uracil-C5-methylase (TrmA/RlmC/RlmD family)
VNDFVAEVERPALGGGIAHAPDGRVAFVRDALVGERVTVRVTDEARRFVRGEAVAVARPAPGRVAPPCPYAGPGRCGGCDLQHADGPSARAWKEAVVREQMSRIAGLEVEVELRDAPSGARGSRTRLRCAVDPSGRLGLRRRRSHEVEVLATCWLADARLAPAFARRWDGAGEVELRAIGPSEPFAVVTGADGAARPCALDGSDRPAAASRVEAAGHDFLVSPASFWQSHRDAPGVLGSVVRRLAAPHAGDRVVDLYSGVGLLAAAVARDVGPRGRVVCVESSPSALGDARVNLADTPWTDVRAARVTLAAVDAAVARDSIVLADPPRAGLGEGVAEAIGRSRPRRVVYVSCDAPTLARDLRKFLAAGFDLMALEAYDFFPETEHVELVAVLDATTRAGG